MSRRRLGDIRRARVGKRSASTVLCASQALVQAAQKSGGAGERAGRASKQTTDSQTDREKGRSAGPERRLQVKGTEDNGIPLP